MNQIQTTDLGTTTVSIMPTDDNVIVAGKALNSSLGFFNKKYDEGEKFTYEVVAFGNKVIDLKIGDIVKVQPGSFTDCTLEENDKTFDRVSGEINKLTPIEFRTLQNGLPTHQKVTFIEHFLIKRYAILGIMCPTSLPSTASNTLQTDDVNLSNK